MGFLILMKDLVSLLTHSFYFYAIRFNKVECGSNFILLNETDIIPHMKEVNNTNIIIYFISIIWYEYHYSENKLHIWNQTDQIMSILFLVYLNIFMFKH